MVFQHVGAGFAQRLRSPPLGGLITTHAIIEQIAFVPFSTARIFWKNA
jgi:hypothetical protein